MGIYMAYGSNCNLTQLKNRCPDARKLGTVMLEDYKLTFKGDSGEYYATIEPHEGSVVPVVVWELSEADEAELDEYEDYPLIYEKKYLPVTLHGETYEAMIYMMYDYLMYGEPQEGYCNEIAEGYRQNGFDLSILRKAAEECIG
ncbi:MAG: gamma-glutamylcyclotransferase family protein [Butyricicoccaceae bacterium]